MVDVVTTADYSAQMAQLNAQVAALNKAVFGGGGVVGPVANGYVTADFGAAFNYPGKGAPAAQQVIDRRMYGTSTGGAADNGWAKLADPGYTSLMGSVNPGLWYINGNEAGGWFDGSGAVKPSAFANLLSGFPLVDPAGISGIMFGLNWDSIGFVGGNASNYGTCASRLATFLAGAKMAGGKPLPVLGFAGHDEPDGIPQGTIQAMMAALVPAVKAVNPSWLIMGPQTSWAGALMPWFMQQVHVDVCSWDMYPSGSDIGTQAWTNPQYYTRASGDMANMAGLVPYMPKAFMIGGFNLDWNCSAASQHNYIGAMWAGIVVIQSLNNAPGPFWSCIWDAEGDGTCGFVPDASNPVTPGQPQALTPFAYLWREAVQRVWGPRWQVVSQKPGLLTCACTPSPGHASLMVVNAGQGSVQNQPVAFSRWPGNASGNGTARVWQVGTGVTNIGQDGTVTQAPVTAGVLQASLPDPSITVFSV